MDVIEPAREFKTNLHRIRTAAGLTVSQLAVKADLSGNSIFGYEWGVRLPSLETLRRLAKALGCRVVDLLEGE